MSLNGTINYQISPEISGCSWSIGIVPINYTMVMTFSYLYNEKYSKFFFWEVNESNITLLFSSNSNLFKNLYPAYCKYVRLSQGTITICCCTIDCTKIAC